MFNLIQLKIPLVYKLSSLKNTNSHQNNHRNPLVYLHTIELWLHCEMFQDLDAKDRRLEKVFLVFNIVRYGTYESLWEQHVRYRNWKTVLYTQKFSLYVSRYCTMTVAGIHNLCNTFIQDPKWLDCMPFYSIKVTIAQQLYYASFLSLQYNHII